MLFGIMHCNVNHKCNRFDSLLFLSVGAVSMYIGRKRNNARKQELFLQKHVNEQEHYSAHPIQEQIDNYRTPAPIKRPPRGCMNSRS